MQFFVGLHFTMVPLIWLFGGLGTIWGIVLLVRKQSIDRLMRILLGITASLGILQALIGGALFLFFHLRPANELHYVYGLIVLVGIPVAYAYADNKPEADKKTARRDMIVFTIAIAAVAAAAVRAFMTGCPPVGCR